MSRLPGTPASDVDDAALREMAGVLATIHAVRPETPFRTFQSWAWEAKWVVPAWTRRPESWRRAFDVLWVDGSITGVVDWVETSSGPAWLDAAHAATNLAVAFGTRPAEAFLEHWSATSGTAAEPNWLVMDAVGFLPPPGRRPMFARPEQLERLDAWLDLIVSRLS